MLNAEKEACVILDVATATISLAYHLVKSEKVKRVVPAVRNELLALRNELNTSDHSFDPARVDALVTEIVEAGSSQPSTKLATSLGSATLDLACAKVRYAALKVGSPNPWGVNLLAFDSLKKLSDVLYALARDEE